MLYVMPNFVTQKPPENKPNVTQIYQTGRTVVSLSFSQLRSLPSGSVNLYTNGMLAQDLRLFLVWDADSVETTEDTVVSELFKAAEGPDCSDEENNTKRKTNSKNDKKKRKKSRKQSTSSDSSTSDDSKSDDSTSDTESSSSSSSTKVCWGVHACCFL